MAIYHIWYYITEKYGQKGRWESPSPLFHPQESSTKHFSQHILYVADSIILLQYLNGKLIFRSLKSKILKAHSSSLTCMKFPDGILPDEMHHIPSFTTLRSRWFPLAFHCDSVKANLVMLRNLERMRRKCCKMDTFLPPLAVPSLLLFQASVFPPGLKNSVALTFFLFESVYFWPSCFRGSTC